MAKLVVTNDNNQPLASVNIPNSYVDFVRAIVGGETAQETAANFLAEAIPALRAHFLGRRNADEQSALMAEREAKQTAAQTELDEAWPQ